MEELFELPEPDLDELSFCGVSDDEFTAWLASLPMANIGETSRQLFNALGEIVHLQCSARQRFSFLESIRASLHYVGKSLEKHFVTQAVILDEHQLSVANRVQSMHTQLSAGYQLVIRDLLSGEDAGEHPELMLATAIYRAISELGVTALRSCQMYAGAPQDAWLKLHSLYETAESRGLLRTDCIDPENRHSARGNIETSYKRLLLLGCCKPNQLRPRELETIYHALEIWAPLAEIHDEPVTDDLFSFHLTEDRLVSYRKLAGNEGEDKYWRGLCTSALVEGLRLRAEELAEGGALSKGADRLEIPDGITLPIINHLLHSWGAFFERGDGRTSVNSPLSVCIGLTAVQYFIGGMIDFSLQMSGGKTLHGQGGNPFMEGSLRNRPAGSDDAWSGAFDAGGGGFGDIDIRRLEDLLGVSNRRGPPRVRTKKADTWEAMADKTPRQPLFSLHLVDTSPGGRCISWGAQPSDRVQDGQLIAFRENDDEPWTIGVVRWIQHRDNELRTGVEILAPTALACGAAMIMRDRPAADYMRALELPPMEAVGQKATLILPNVPFKENGKIWINRRGKLEKAILERCLFSTGSFAHFEYRSLEVVNIEDEKKGLQLAKEEKKDDKKKKPNDGLSGAFDNLWEKL